MALEEPIIEEDAGGAVAHVLTHAIDRSSIPMPHLFSSLRLDHIRLPNRIALAPLPSSYADASGFVTPLLVNYYARRAQGGVGLLLPEPAFVAPPDALSPHLGLYHDSQIAGLSDLVEAIHSYGGYVLLPLECVASEATFSADQLDVVRDMFLRAAWRALAAGCDGVMLSAADGGLLHTLLSPLHNRREDAYGGTFAGRLHMALGLVEGLRSWFGKRLLVAFRLNADELSAGGMTIQDAQVIARRLANSGVQLFDITIDVPGDAPIARFPGWRVPLAATIKRVLLDMPVMTSGSLGDPLVADGVIREGSADLVMLGQSLRTDPDWPQRARAVLHGLSDS